MTPRTITFAIGAGVLSALIFALVLTREPMAYLFSPFPMLPLLLIGLSSPLAVGALSAGAGVLVIGLIGGSASWAALYAAAEAVPALGLSRLALRQRPDASGRPRFTQAGPLFTAALLYAAALVLVLYLAFLDQPGGLLGELQEIIHAGLQLAYSRQSDPAVLEQYASEIAQAMPGAMAGWWLIILLANLAIAQTLLTRWNRALRPSLWLTRMVPPRWLVLVFGATLVLGLILPDDAGFLAMTMAMICFVPFFFVGMVCIHYLCKGWPPGPFVLIGIYLVLLFVQWAALLAAAILGIAEQWLRLRERIAGPQPV